MTDLSPGNLALTEPFDELARITLAGVAASSARVYGQTYRLWRDFCRESEHNPLDMRPAPVLSFLDARPSSKATRQRQLSAMRKLAQMSFVLTGEDAFQRAYEALKLVRAPAGVTESDRLRRALAPHEVLRIFHVWQLDRRMHRRNAALIAVLALSGIRRSEAAVLRWGDVDFDNGVVHIRHGKGDRAREAVLAGELALDALRAWQMDQPAGRTFVFCPLERGDHLGADRPLDGSDIYRIVRQTELQSGVVFRPHDLRRTFITEALATGSDLRTVQSLAGHARGETTLLYAQAVDARRARRSLKLRYS